MKMITNESLEAVYIYRGSLKENKKKNIKGITLIALVITIIILLILAGISISALTQTGLFEKTKQAEQKYENAQVEENITLASYENEIENNLKGAARENENNDIYDISTYQIGAARVFDSRLTDIQGGYKVIGDTVYVYLTAKTVVKLPSNNSWVVLTNLPKAKINMPLNIVSTLSGEVLGGINCGITSLVYEKLENSSIGIGTSSKDVPVNSLITIIGSYPKE